MDDEIWVTNRPGILSLVTDTALSQLVSTAADETTEEIAQGDN